ncbi:MAG: PQQ-binding-like beta-propeller repeat protein [Anaerolineales bacterium]|nr:PQQ-binding-like beta-propeller repeat protein [Anaerolineales bacterium]
MDKNKALQKLLDGTATKKEIEALKQALVNGEISIGGDVNRSVVIIGSGNKVELTAEALGILKPETTTEEPVAGESPYMGLRYFDTTDADLFYGRETLTAELLKRVKNEAFLAIVGASGSGKSSVARAGLIPAWKQDNERGIVHVITPMAHPLESLAASLTSNSESVTATSTLMDDLAKDTRSLRLYVKKTFGETKMLLLVDQFEETFTLCKDVGERKAFIDNLLSLTDDNGTASVVITLRADFYHRCFEYEGLRLTLEKHQVNLGAMTSDELREAITAPAKNNGWDFQPGLVDLILQDIGSEPGALPLLSHALLETWKRRQGHTLTLKGYHEAGGVKKAITQTAESVYDRLLPAEQTIARNIFLRLTELGEGTQDTRRRVKMDELGLSKEQDDVSKVLKTLSDARLVTTEADSAEVAHEALIREWGTLRKWLDEDRESLRLYRQLTESALEWDRSKKQDTFLVHRGGRLDDALALKKNSFIRLSTGEEKYLDACVELRSEGERRSRITIIASITAAVVFLFLGAFGLLKSNEAQRQANIALARQLAAQAHLANLDRSSNQMTATLLAIQSMKLFPNADAARFLINNNFSARPVSSMTDDSKIGSVAFSADGKYVVSGSWDNTARIWEAATGIEVARLTHEDDVVSVAFSPSGKYVLTGSWDGTARVWDATTGIEVARMAHDDIVYSVAFSPETPLGTGGKYVASGSGDNTVRVWEAATGLEVARMTHDGPVTIVAFSPDGRYVASGSVDSTARVWDASTGKEVARMTHNGNVVSVAFTPDSKYIVSASGDFTARVWEAATGQEVARMTHDSAVNSVAFSPDGRYVVSGGWDNTVRVWKALTGEEIARMTHDDFVSSVAFSPEGRYVVTGSGDHTARVWGALTGIEVARMTHDGVVSSVAFSPNIVSDTGSEYVVSASEDHTARVWKTATGKETARMTHDSDVISVVFSPNGKFVATGNDDITARVWDASTGSEVARMTHEGAVNSVAFSPDSRYIVSGSEDNTARVWEASTGQEVSRMTHEGAVTSVAFSPDAPSGTGGRYVVSGSEDHTARVWDAATGREIARMTHEGAVTSVAFSPDGRYIVSGGYDNTARVWDAATGQEVARMTYEGTVYSVEFSPDGRYVVSGSEDNTARVWDASTGSEVSRMTHEGAVYVVAFSSDGKHIVSGSYDNTARVWDTATGQEVARMIHDSLVIAVAFSPDGRYVISGGYDNTARVWDAATGQEVARMTHDSPVTSMAFSPDTSLVTGGKYVVSGSGDHTARVWEWQAEDLIANACAAMPRNLTRDEWKKYIVDALPYQAVCEKLTIEQEITVTSTASP